MDRRKFFSRSVAAGVTMGSTAIGGAPMLQRSLPAQPPPAKHSDLPSRFTPSAYSFPRSEWTPFATSDYYMYADDLVIEHNRPGKPHQGKVLAAVQAHSDDVTIGCGGTVAKLIEEGYTGYLIRVSNDEASGSTLGHGVAQNEIDNQEAAKALGCKKAFSFYYRNHRMDDDSIIEIRARLIFMFRLLRVNTVLAMDPYDHYDENPDHLVVGSAVERACWMSGGSKDYPEHFKAGLKPANVQEKYYFPRSPQGHNLTNRIVDIGSYIDTKVRANMANKGKGPAGTYGARLRRELARDGKKLPMLGDDDETANFVYVKHFLMDGWQRLGQQFGLGYAEAFRYIGPEVRFGDNIRKYAYAHAVSL
ncbi:MAG TPA: PIG-L family deacetylase [Bryobacteraceae bacterium]|nr:PIG-L family deacetylase [Bryobacteraceae bacterium]